MSRSAIAVKVPPGLEAQHDLWSDTTMDAEIAMVGPYGSGKTFALFVKTMLLSAVNAEMRVDGLLVVPTYPLARVVHIQEWPRFAEEMGVSLEYLKSDQAFLWPWGTATWLRSAENPRRLAGPNLAYVCFDEPGQIEREAYDRAKPRARHPRSRLRQICLAGTPEGLNWFADEFANPRPPRRTIWAREWHPSLGDYPQRLLEMFAYDESLLDAYVGGMFVPLQVGRAYRAFSRHSNVRSFEPELGMRWVLACDFNVDTMRWLVAQVGTSLVLVHDEIVLGRSGSTEEACKVFKSSRWADLVSGELWVTGDAAGQARSTSGKSDYTIIREELGSRFSLRLLVPGSNPRVSDRVKQVNYILHGRGGRSIEIHERCKDLILDLERVAWRAGGMELDKSDPLRTHSSDAFGYLVWQMARSIVGRVGKGVVVGQGNPAYAAW